MVLIDALQGDVRSIILNQTEMWSKRYHKREVEIENTFARLLLFGKNPYATLVFSSTFKK